MTSKTNSKSKFSAFLKPLREPSQISMISLSLLMLCFVTVGVLSYTSQHLDLYQSEKPFLAAGRDETQGGKEFMSNRMKNAPLLYGGAHILPAAIWSILIPTQHMSYIRRNYIQFHRIAGWLIVISAISLSISGSLFPLFNLSYSDPNLFHVHYLLIPLQVLPFFSKPIYVPYPTFNLLLKPLPFLQLFPLYKAIQSIRVEKNISKHKYWMTLHTIAGYLISLQRVAQATLYATGWIIAGLSTGLQERLASAFDFPRELEDPRTWEIERSAFGLTASVAYIWTALWLWRLVSRKDQVVVGQGSGKGEKLVRDTSL